MSTSHGLWTPLSYHKFNVDYYSGPFHPWSSPHF
jgi:hypothetical protein